MSLERDPAYRGDDEEEDKQVEMLKTVRDMGITVVMCTGDNSKTAEAVEKELGIEEIHAGVSPKDKQKIVKQLHDEGHRVAMAGDGINDAPALAD